MIANYHYILDPAGNPVEEPDLMKWAEWMEQPNSRIVKQDSISSDPEPIRVSTVFLGLNYNFSLAGPPVLWETMIFKGPHDQYQDRYSSKADALAGHEYALKLAKGEVTVDSNPTL